MWNGGFGVCNGDNQTFSRRNCRQPIADPRLPFDPPPTDDELGGCADDHAVVEFCRDQGVIVGRAGGGRSFGDVIVLSPLLVITRAECDRRWTRWTAPWRTAGGVSAVCGRG